MPGDRAHQGRQAAAREGAHSGRQGPPAFSRPAPKARPAGRRPARASGAAERRGRAECPEPAPDRRRRTTAVGWRAAVRSAGRGRGPRRRRPDSGYRSRSRRPSGPCRPACRPRRKQCTLGSARSRRPGAHAVPFGCERGPSRALRPPQARQPQPPQIDRRACACHVTASAPARPPRPGRAHGQAAGLPCAQIATAAALCAMVYGRAESQNCRAPRSPRPRHWQPAAGMRAQPRPQATQSESSCNTSIVGLDSRIWTKIGVANSGMGEGIDVANSGMGDRIDRLDYILSSATAIYAQYSSIIFGT